MKLMLDTNICIAIIKSKPAHILQKFNAHKVGDIYLSSVTLAELRYGVAKSQYQEKIKPRSTSLFYLWKSPHLMKLPVKLMAYCAPIWKNKAHLLVHWIC